MPLAGYWDALDKLAGAYGERNRLRAVRAAFLAHGGGCMVVAALSLTGGQWLPGVAFAAGAVGLSAVGAAARRRMRRCDREIALLRVFIFRIEQGRGGLWTH